MSRAGRKRKAPVTLPGNTLATLKAAEKANRMVETALVRSQPHRRGSDATECATALGRLWLSLRTDDKTLLHAGEAYAGLVRRWRSAWGAKNGQTPSEGAGTGLGPSDATVRAWKASIERIEARLICASHAVYRTTTRLAIDDLDPDRPMDAVLGLRIIAVEMGMCGKDHPFR